MNKSEVYWTNFKSVLRRAYNRYRNRLIKFKEFS